MRRVIAYWLLFFFDTTTSSAIFRFNIRFNWWFFVFSRRFKRLHGPLPTSLFGLDVVVIYLASCRIG